MSSSSAPPIKFRCHQCSKLLGVSRSKAGSVATCPQCGAELIVPDSSSDLPVAPPPARSEGGLSGSGVRKVEPGVVPWDSTPEADPEPAIEPSFLNLRTEPFSLRPEPPPRPRPRPATATSPAPEPTPDLATALASVAQEPTSIRDEAVPVRGAKPTLRDPTPRRSDVVLPRTAVLLWSFLVLLAVVLAFSTGLLVGRYVWAPGIRVTSIRS